MTGKGEDAVYLEAFVAGGRGDGAGPLGRNSGAVMPAVDLDEHADAGAGMRRECPDAGGGLDPDREPDACGE